MNAALRPVPYGNLLYDYSDYVRELDQRICRKNQVHLDIATNSFRPLKIRKPEARRAFELDDAFSKFLNLNNGIAARLAMKGKAK